MAHIIEHDTANEIWTDALNLINKEGRRVKDTLEISQAVLTLSNPRQKWVSDRYKPMSIAFALVELVWICSGSNKCDIINYWNPAYKTYAADANSDTYHGAYGYRLKNYNGLNQLEHAYYSLKNNPDNRQTVLLYWDPTLDMPLKNGNSQSKDIPCNICSMIKIRNGKLEWTQIMRSNDIYKGLPYNLVQFTSLQEILSGWLNVKVGHYTHISDSLHIYDQDANCCAKRYSNRVNNDILSIPKSDSDQIISEIYRRLELIVANQNLSYNRLKKLSTLGSKFEAYNNLLLIICSYVSNKLKIHKLTDELLSQCTNLLYIEMMKAFINKNVG